LGFFSQKKLKRIYFNKLNLMVGSKRIIVNEIFASRTIISNGALDFRCEGILKVKPSIVSERDSLTMLTQTMCIEHRK